jgi:hypothetical protein
VGGGVNSWQGLEWMTQWVREALQFDRGNDLYVRPLLEIDRAGKALRCYCDEQAKSLCHWKIHFEVEW